MDQMKKYWPGISRVVGDLLRIFLLTIYVMPDDQPYLTLLGSLFLVLIMATEPATRITGAGYGFLYGLILSPVMMFYYANVIRHDSVGVLDVLGLSVILLGSLVVGYAAGLIIEARQAVVAAYRAVIETKERVARLEAKVEALIAQQTKIAP
jgi:hypothetical protein